MEGMPSFPRGAVRRSLDASIKDGLCWSVMMGFAEQTLVPFALFLHAGSVHVGVLRSLPQLLNSLFLLKTADWVNAARSRKRVVSIAAFLQAASLGAAALCAFLPRGTALRAFLACAALYSFFGVVAGPAWCSLMGEYLPASKRGGFFGMRNQLAGLSWSGFGLAAGCVLAWFGKGRAAGFVLLFLCACAARFASWGYILRMFEPPFRESPGEAFTFSKFVAKFPRSNFTLFTFACSLVMLGTTVAAPFFGVYLLEALRYDYLPYMAVITAGTLSGYASMRAWGRVADSVGGVRVVRIAAWLIPSIPLFWCLGRGAAYLFAVEAFSGVVWAAYLMGTNNFIYDAVTPAKRTRCAAYYSALTGLATCIGTFAGGYLYGHLPALRGHSFVSLLLLSAGLRVLAAAYL